jgi:hypothetical protein
MIDKPTPAPAPENEPVLPDDSKQWADLAKELETDGDEEPSEPPETEAKTEETPDPEPKPKLTYEQLESNYENARGAFTYERERARRAEESLQNVNKLIEELRASRRPPPQPAPAEQEIPDVNTDPIGHFQARTAILEQALAHTYQGAQQTQQHLHAQHQEQVFWDHVRASEAEARKVAPVVEVNGQQVSDYDAACEHLKQHRMSELMHLYPDNSQLAQQEARAHGLGSPAQLRVAILQSDAAGIAQRAFQLGVSPAQLYYEAAKTRGYRTPQARGANGQFTNGKANGQIEATKRGQKAALTISGGEGRKTANDMTISDLSELWAEDPEEFDKQWERMKRAGKL